MEYETLVTKVILVKGHRLRYLVMGRIKYTFEFVCGGLMLRF